MNEGTPRQPETLSSIDALTGQLKRTVELLHQATTIEETKRYERMILQLQEIILMLQKKKEIKQPITPGSNFYEQLASIQQTTAQTATAIPSIPSPGPSKTSPPPASASQTTITPTRIETPPPKIIEDPCALTWDEQSYLMERLKALGIKEEKIVQKVITESRSIIERKRKESGGQKLGKPDFKLKDGKIMIFFS